MSAFLPETEFLPGFSLWCPIARKHVRKREHNEEPQPEQADDAGNAAQSGLIAKMHEEQRDQEHFARGNQHSDQCVEDAKVDVSKRGGERGKNQ